MRRTFDEKFKEMIVNLYNNGTPVLEIEKEYGITNSLIYKWIHQRNGKGIYKNSNDIVLKSDYKAMQKRLKYLEMENDILKKAQAIFAQDQLNPKDK